MTDIHTLQALLERVQAATGANSELDEALAYVTQFRPTGLRHLESFALHEAKHDYGTSWVAHRPWHREWNIPTYTASIDAALALVERVLPDAGVQLYWTKDGAAACLSEPPKFVDHWSQPAKLTPPLAILAALLQALIANATP